MVATVNIQSNSESIVNVATLQISTDAGAPAATSFGLGFSPRVVRLIDLTGLVKDEWFEGMVQGSSLHTASNGALTNPQAGGITVTNLDGSSLSGGSVSVPAALLPVSSLLVLEAIG